MTTGIRMKYVHCWVDKRHGGARARYYFRRPGFKRLPCPVCLGQLNLCGLMRLRSQVKRYRAR